MHAFMPSQISQLVARHACEVNDDGSSTSKSVAKPTVDLKTAKLLGNHMEERT